MEGLGASCKSAARDAPATLSGTSIAAPKDSQNRAERACIMDLKPLMVRYIVNDVEATIAFYTKHFGFRVSAQSGAYFAILERDNLQLVLSPPKGPGGGSQPMPGGERPEPGGWNRLIVKTDALDDEVATLRKAGVQFRNDIVSGPGGRQILVKDPSGNLIELFEQSAESENR
jgi:glyoxylase I family protein